MDSSLGRGNFFITWAWRMAMMVLILTPLAVLAAKPAQSSEVLKIGSVAPDNTPWAKLLREFNRRFQASGEMPIRFEYGFGGSMGGEHQLLKRCREGKIAIAGVSSTIVANLLPELNLLELPYLFDSNDEIDLIIEEVIDPAVRPKLHELGLEILLWTDNGYKNIATVKKPIRSLQDMEGLKLRSQESPLYKALFRSLGASCVCLNIREVAEALQAGVVDGFDNTPLFTFSSGLYHYVKHYTQTRHSYQPVLMLASRKVLEAMDENVRQAFIAEARNLKEFGRREIRLGQIEALDKLKKSGIQIHRLELANRASIIEASRKVYDSVETLVGPDGMILLARVRKTLAERRKSQFSQEKDKRATY